MKTLVAQTQTAQNMAGHESVFTDWDHVSPVCVMLLETGKY